MNRVLASAAYILMCRYIGARLGACVKACAGIALCAFASQSFAVSVETPGLPIDDSREAMHNLLLGEFSAWRGDMPQAVKYYQANLGSQSSAKVAERMTRLAFHAKDYSSMLVATDAWIQASPEQAKAHFYKSLAAANLAMHDVALSEMSEDLRLGGATDFTRLVNSFEGQSFDAEELYIKTLDNYEQQLSVLLKKHAHSYDLPLALALLALRNNDSQKAKEMALSARANGKENPAVLEFTIKVFERIGAVEEVQVSYLLLLDLKPNNTKVRHRYALFLTDENNLAAIEQLLILNRHYPNNGDYLFHLSLIYIETSQDEKAVSSLEQLLAIGSHLDDVHYYLGLLAIDKGDESDAENHFLQIKGQRLLGKRYQALLQLYLTQNNLDAAVQQSQLLEPLLTTEDASVANYLSQSSLYALQGDFEAALAALNELEKINNELSQLYYRRAMIYRQTRQLENAERAMRRFITLEPQNAEAMHLLGQWVAEVDH